MNGSTLLGFGTRFRAALLFLILLAAPVHADPYFDNTRIDSLVPANCQQMELRNFATVNRVVLVSIRGAKAAGFTHEYPIARGDANTLWLVMRGGDPTSSRIISTFEQNAEMREHYRILSELGPKMGFDFSKEGDILEVLALQLLKSEYPEKDYFFTGGMTYGNGAQTRVLGEMDVMIGRRSDCAIVAIGESKLGLGQRNHAMEQIRRFQSFLKGKLCTRGEKSPVCRLPLQ